MTKKIQPLDDQQLLDAVRDAATTSSSFVDSTLAAERREVTEYYLGERPVPVREGGSKFVSQDVYLSVEAMKAELVETFGAGSKIVQFSPQNSDDVQMAREATAYCEWSVHRDNDGLLIFQDIVHDGLTNRFGIAKVYWDSQDEHTTYKYKGITEGVLNELLANPKVKPVARPTGEIGQDGLPVYTGEYVITENVSRVAIEAIPPEEFITKGRFKNLRKARYVAHRYRTTLGELVEDGYDADLVYSISTQDDDLELNEEAAHREQLVAGVTLLHDEDGPDEASRMVTVYESYIRIDVRGTGRPQLWKVVHCGDTILDKQEVSDHPFVVFIPQPLPHTFFGNNFAKRTINHANTKTVLTRAIIEQAVEATNPRWQVARGGVANPRELLDNRRGGVVNVRDVGTSIATLPQQPINPFVPQVIAMVDSDREDTTGITRLAQGLDKKALSHQNSQGLVEQLSDNSKTRTKVIARNFALQFISQLYLKVYKLALENDDRERILDLAGSFTPVDPRKWTSRRDVTVDMTLGYGERDQRVSELADLHKVLSGDPKMGRMYGEQQAYELWREALDIKGIKNIDKYLADPSKLDPPQPDPRDQAEVAKIVKETEVLERQQALRERQVDAQITREEAESLFKQEMEKLKVAIQKQEADRKDREVDNRIDIGLAELELAIDTHTTASPENQKLTAIASPNS